MTTATKLTQAATLIRAALTDLDAGHPARKDVEAALTVISDIDWHNTDLRIIRTWVACAAEWLGQAAKKLEGTSND